MVYERELDLMYRSFEEVGMLLRRHTDIMQRHIGTLTTVTMLIRKNVTVCGMSKAAREGDKRKGRDIQLLSDIHESLRCLSQREVEVVIDDIAYNGQTRHELGSSAVRIVGERCETATNRA